MRWVSYTRSISSRIGEENPANTIAEQNANIEQYLKNKGYRISEKYSDRKRSAEAADGFDQMVQDGMTQKFDAVAVDSIFRFGKTLPFAIEVLQKTFYPVGIQFAVVEDDFCSIDRTADEVEQYFKEKVIEKIRFEFMASRQDSFEKGVLTHRQAKYGYDISEDRRSFVLDSESAYIVKLIFQMYLEGMTLQEIGAALDAQNVPSPQIQMTRNKKVTRKTKWPVTTIRSILVNPLYIGKLTLKLSGAEKKMEVPPIVSEEDFQKVQERINTYVDNGFTGTNFDRPEFERMMQDVRTGKIQCIVVKDLSRFGRDYIETGNYLETIFPMLHIRFIAINDDFDNIRQSDVDSLAVPIKNMVNSLYAKDISKKIGLSYQMRREKGIPTSWCVPYGYRMNEQKSQYEVADEAKYVKLIYQWYLMGLSTNEIARRLEFLEVPRPNEHLNRRLHEGHDTTFNKWHSSSVLRILDSQVYIGNLVTGKTRTASYKGIGLHPVDKEEWHIVENAHEAIILKSDFEIVQEKRNRNKEKRNNAMARSEQVRAECRNHFAGMVFCGCCRRNMTFVRQVHKTEEESYFGVFQCKRKKGTTPCSYHTVPEKMLMMVAMKQIHHLVSTMCEEEKMVKEMLNNGGLDSTRSIKVKESSIACRIQETEERRLRLYEDYKAEILDEEEYSQLKEHYIAEKQRLEHELQKQRQRSLELEKRMRICDEQMERMRAILNQSEFDEELVHELIKKIYVGMDNSVEVEFKCSDPYQEVLAIMSEVQNE